MCFLQGTKSTCSKECPSLPELKPVPFAERWELHVASHEKYGRLKDFHLIEPFFMSPCWSQREIISLLDFCLFFLLFFSSFCFNRNNHFFARWLVKRTLASSLEKAISSGYHMYQGVCVHDSYWRLLVLGVCPKTVM